MILMIDMSFGFQELLFLCRQSSRFICICWFSNTKLWLYTETYSEFEGKHWCSENFCAGKIQEILNIRINGNSILFSNFSSSSSINFLMSIFWNVKFYYIVKYIYTCLLIFKWWLMNYQIQWSKFLQYWFFY